MRCKDPKICSKQGTTVIVTDLNTNNQTDFVISSRAFTAMAIQGKAQDVLKLGIADIEYKRLVLNYTQYISELQYNNKRHIRKWTL